MPKGGLEPPHPFEYNALNVACLPISPLRLADPPSCGRLLYYCISYSLSIPLQHIFLLDQKNNPPLIVNLLFPFPVL
jgi:hypothetical protein